MAPSDAMTNTSETAHYRLAVGQVFAYSDDNQNLRLDTLDKAALVSPDLITLDLEMPRMDGFTFLRILMSKQPTPVIVISSQSQRENVFKALELGALDFVSRPAGGRSRIPVP